MSASPPKQCLRCGLDMSGRWSHICPACGKFFAASTPRQVAIQLSVSLIVAVIFVVLLVVLLWQLS